MSRVQKALAEMKQPIIALGGGYMPYFAKSTASSETGRTTSVAGSAGQPRTQPIPVWKNNNDYVYGYYKGNYILYNYYRKMDLEHSGMEAGDFSMRPGMGDSIVNRALQGIVEDVNSSEFSYTGKFDPTLKSVEEQPMVSGVSTPERQGGRAFGVDMKVGNELNQVSYTKLVTHDAHHGIEKGGKARSTMVKAISAANKDKKLTEEQRYKKKAKAALQYYKTQISAVNKIMLDMQSGGAMGGKELRSEIEKVTVKEGPKGKVKKIMGKGNKVMMREAMIGFTKTALGNLDDYREGVYSTLPMSTNPPVHAKIGKFILTKRGKIRFREPELKHALVRYGLDSTTTDLLLMNDGLRAYDVNAARTFGQVFGDIKANADHVTVGAMTSGTISGTVANNTKIYPSIDIMAAGEDLSMAIAGEGGLLDFIKDGSMKATNNFSSNHILGNKMTMNMGTQTFWALPYLTVYDGYAMRYGA